MPRTHVALGGGRSRARTCDPGLVRAVLFQLSYPPVPGFSLSYGQGSISWRARTGTTAFLHAVAHAFGNHGPAIPDPMTRNAGWSGLRWYAVVGHLTLPWSVEGNEPALGRVFRAAEGTHRYGRAALRPAPPRESENHPAVIRDGLRPAVYGRSPYVLYSSATFGD